MSSITTPGNYWCHECSQMIPGLTVARGCPVCGSEFVEEVEEPDQVMEVEEDEDEDSPFNFVFQWPPSQSSQPPQEQEDNPPFPYDQTHAPHVAHFSFNIGEGGNIFQQLQQQFHQQHQMRNNMFASLNSAFHPTTPTQPSPAAPQSTQQQQQQPQQQPQQQQQPPTNFIEMLQRLMTSDLGAMLAPMAGLDSGDFVVGSNMQDLLNRFLHPEGRVGPPPAAKEEVSSLQARTKTQENIDNAEECNICKDEYELNEDTLLMPCGHDFHPHCIKKWLEMHNSCPTCRFEMRTDDEDYERQKMRRSRTDARH